MTSSGTTITPTPPPAQPTQSQVSASGELLNGRAVALIVSALVLVAFLSVYTKTFLTARTMETLAPWIAVYVLLGLSQAMCLVVGGMNISVGGIGSIVTVLFGVMLARWSAHPLVSVPLALLVGCLAGLINGLIITKVKIDSFIVTLCTSFVFVGLKNGISGGEPQSVPDALYWIGQGSFLGIQMIFAVVIVLLLVASYMYGNTVFGRRLLATGGNIDAARLSGINTNSMITWAHVLSGALAGVCAILYACYYGSATPTTGDDWVLDSFAVAIIGGTGLNGGSVSPLGIFMGATIYKLIRYGLVALKVNDRYASCFIGALILLSIVVDRVRETYANRQK
jgi:ribose transport system permease protein